MRRSVLSVVVLLSLITQLTTNAVAGGGLLTFSDISSMPATLFFQTATVLKDGRILIAGGSDAPGRQVADAYLYNPDTDQYVPTGSMNRPRHSHTATLLNDGRVLVVGGWNDWEGWLSDAEVYDPVSETWTVVSPLYSHGVCHTATALDDGLVFVIGGAIGSGQFSDKVEFFDPSDDTWTEQSSMPEPRGGHTATLLDDGKILLAGGGSFTGGDRSDSRVYDPVTDSFSDLALMTVGSGSRSLCEAIKLKDGRVLAVGGIGPNTEILASVEIYDPDTDLWTATASMSFARYGHKLVLLPDGTVLVAGGADLYENQWMPNSFIKMTEIFDPQTMVWNKGPIMKDARVSYALAALDESHWFLFGGISEPSIVQDSACKLTWESITIVDNADTTGVEIVGAWTESTGSPGYWPTNYIHDGKTEKGTKSVTFRPDLPSSTGYYEVSIWYTAGANRATNVPVDIVCSCGTRTVLVNESVNGGKWVVLGQYPFAAGTNGYVKIRTDNTSSGYVIADAVRFRPVAMTDVILDNADAKDVEIVGTWTGSTSTPGYWPTNYIHDGKTGKGTKSVTFRPTLDFAGNYEVSIWYTAGANRATNVPVDIVYAGNSKTVVVNQRVKGGQWVVLGTNQFATGTNGYVRIRTDGTANGHVIVDAVRFRPVPVTEWVVDNADITGVEMMGAWTGSTSTPGYWSINYIHDGNIGKGMKSVTFRPNLICAGNYEVSIWYTAGSNRATNVPIDIVYSGGTRTVLVNEQVQGGQWLVLGTNNFEVGTSGYVRIRTDGTSGYVIADAVRFKPVGASALVSSVLTGASK